MNMIYEGILRDREVEARKAKEAKEEKNLDPVTKELRELRKEVARLNAKSESAGDYFVGNHADQYQSKEYLKKKEERFEKTGGGRFRSDY